VFGEKSYALRKDLPATALTMAAVLATFGVALAVQRAAHQSAALAVLGVVLALTLSRVARRHPLGPAQLLAVPVIGLLAAAVGRLMVLHPAAGDPLFVLAVSGAIWVRRFGARATRVGTLVALPFVAMLITPVPPGGGPEHLLWSAVIAVVAVGAVLATQHPAAPPVPPAPVPAAARRGRVLPSTRMAVQMAVALAAAFAVGRLLFPAHWPWLVLSAYLVNTGNRGRGDVVHKAAQRVAGAAAGTVLATLLAGALPAHHPIQIGLLFVVLAVAGWLRGLGYAYWAAGVTGALSLLYGYFGADDPGLLAARLLAILLGAGLGVAAGWLVLPVRTGDVLRRRIADSLAALTDYLVSARRDRSELPDRQRRWEASLDELDRLSPTLRAQRRLTRLSRAAPRTHQADAVGALLACRAATRQLTRDLTTTGQPPDPELLAGLDGLRDDVVALRRALGRRGPVPAPRDPAGHPALAQLHTALARTSAVIQR
jgi:uncharacterized membrane protein YccC